MPYKCEDCRELGARMNMFFSIRLCDKCSHSFKYKLMSKSKALEQYKLTMEDFNDLDIAKYHCKNPYYKSGPPMTLYLESDIQKIFINKYKNIIDDILFIENPLLDIPSSVQLVLDYINDSKQRQKLNKLDKILSKHNLELDRLPRWLYEELVNSKSYAEYESVISSYLRFKILHRILIEHNLTKYLNHPICHEYIYSNKTNPNPSQIPFLIKFMLGKKTQLKNAIKKFNLPINKYKSLYKSFINSTDTSNQLNISNDIDTLVNYIKEKEFMLFI